MDDIILYAKITHDKIDELNDSFRKHQEHLSELCEKGQISETDKIITDFNETMQYWTTMVDMHRVLYNKIEQESLSKSIEVTGMPEHHTWDLASVAIALSRLLRIPINESYVTGYRRLDEPADPSRKGFPRTLVVDLVSKNIKKRILTVAETISPLRIVGYDMPVTITEHLTPLNHELLRKARAEALRLGIENVWVDEGKIYARRSDVSLIYEIRGNMDIPLMARF